MDTPFLLAGAPVSRFFHDPASEGAFVRLAVNAIAYQDSELDETQIFEQFMYFPNDSADIAGQ